MPERIPVVDPPVMTIFAISEKDFGHHRPDEDRFHDFRGAFWSSSPG
ncbi:hypothetical protein [Ammoniphilus resinae]|uniref:Uncharacterized protein n=1 Tax=Ammoniphilus resinae TaxID=861532 RepID=A0ABS4GIG4_9BACL|nr:hypothetical protein [Ammoniphilus resinae]MBP1930046.1 hypothetical protein [Ammoniphilus resinae]